MSIRPLLQLLRPPNLFTVPGDPLCGALFAIHGAWSSSIVPCMVISLCAYCAGLVINDLADYVEDLRERPARPLPSGAVSRRTALILAIVFVAVAVSTAACVSRPVFFATVFLLALILLYNLFAKRIPKFGPAVMGLCRGASVNLGISAVMPVHTTNQMLPVIVITAYICVLSAAARNETSNPRIPPLIGKLIRGLLFIQAGFCAYAGGIGWAAALLLLARWPVSRLVASRFYAS